MRQINNRMSILDDYIYNIDQDEDKYGAYDKYTKLYEKYSDLRDHLLKKTSYNNRRMYGLFIDYGQFPDSNR